MASMSVKKVLIVEDSTSLNTLYQQYLRNEKVESGRLPLKAGPIAPP